MLPSMGVTESERLNNNTEQFTSQGAVRKTEHLSHNQRSVTPRHDAERVRQCNTEGQRTPDTPEWLHRPKATPPRSGNRLLENNP